MKKPKRDQTFAAKLERAMLEYLAYWEAGMTAERLAALTCRSREHAQRKIIPAYEKAHPQTLAQKWRGKTLADAAEGLRYAPALATLLLDMLRGEQALASAMGEEPRFGPPFEDVASFGFSEPDPDHFQMLYAACIQRRALRLHYVAKSGAMECVFSPHALVRDGSRLHFRGYALADNQKFGPNDPGFSQFVDLVPSRVTRVLEAPNAANYVSSDGDYDWHEREVLIFRLNPKLSSEILGLLSVEYEGVVKPDGSGELRLPDVRKALSLYVRRNVRYRVFGKVMHEIWLPC